MIVEKTSFGPDLWTRITLAIFMSLAIIPVSNEQLIMSVNRYIMHCIVDFAKVEDF